MFLYSKNLGGKTQEALKETMTREILYPLWDSGLKVGHASRDLNEAIAEAQLDIRNKNSMLDTRYISGDRKMSERFMNKFLKH
jgi:[protein-PII] uridylyltransferase